MKRVSCENQPSWYKQLFDMPEEKRKRAEESALERIKRSKPETYEFIRNFKCKLVGFIPNVTYTAVDSSRVDTKFNFVHDFSQTTLLYWCEQGGFSFFVNSSLQFTDDMGFIY